MERTFQRWGYDIHTGKKLCWRKQPQCYFPWCWWWRRHSQQHCFRHKQGRLLRFHIPHTWAYWPRRPWYGFLYQQPRLYQGFWWYRNRRTRYYWCNWIKRNIRYRRLAYNYHFGSRRIQHRPRYAHHSGKNDIHSSKIKNDSDNSCKKNCRGFQHLFYSYNFK